MLLKSKKVRIRKPGDAYEIVKEYLETLDKVDQQKEHLITIGLNQKNDVIYVDLTSVGVLSECLIQPREIFRRAIIKDARSVIMAHNHPSGEEQPSLEDIKVTKRIARSGIDLGIVLMDHLVLGDSGFVSMKAQNLLSN